MYCLGAGARHLPDPSCWRDEFKFECEATPTREPGRTVSFVSFIALRPGRGNNVWRIAQSQPGQQVSPPFPKSAGNESHEQATAHRSLRMAGISLMKARWRE